MEIKKTPDGQAAIAHSGGVIITDVNSALDFIMTVTYETGCRKIALNKSAIAEEFFDLSTRIAGEILQKFVTYQTVFAIIGDFSGYASKSLKDFIYESNRGRHLFFVRTEQEAAERLAAVE